MEIGKFSGAAFSRQISTLCNAYFFGAPSPSVNFALYKRLVKRAFDDYLRISGSKGKESVLLINTLGWIEGIFLNFTTLILGIFDMDLKKVDLDFYIL